MDLNATLDFQRMRDILESELGTTLGEADERLLLLRAIYLVLLNQNAMISRGYSERLLREMTGEFLDEFGEGREVYRLDATNAHTTLRWHIQQAQTMPVIIPRGNRATTQDQSVTFATDATATIPPGSLYVDVSATSLATGEADNGIEPGQVSVIVDPIPFVAQVENIDITAGGSDLESDESYRERIRLEMSKYSTAGAEETYQYWALSANPLIADVAAESPSAGEVLLTVLMEGGQLPEQGILDDVFATVNPEHIRPLTDHVTVQAPEVVTYNIDFNYYAPGDQMETVREAVEGSGGAIQQYIDWQMEQLGRNINPDYLRKLLLEAGVTRIILCEPEYQDVKATQVAHVIDIKAVLSADGGDL